MDSATKDIISQFRKPELLRIAKELGLPASPEDRVTKVVEAILGDIESNGVPEITGEGACSEELAEFLLVAGYIDESGNLLEAKESELAVIEEQPLELPVCFSFADSRDPSCNRCKVFALCEKEAIRLRPPCFGKEFDARADECMACFYAPQCKVIVLGN